VITPRDESVIQLDNLEVAQFIYLLLNNEKIRDMIDTLGKKAVLIQRSDSIKLGDHASGRIRNSVGQS
jgi:hypothetical protein